MLFKKNMRESVFKFKNKIIKSYTILKASTKENTFDLTFIDGLNFENENKQQIMIEEGLAKIFGDNLLRNTEIDIIEFKSGIKFFINVFTAKDSVLGFKLDLI